MTGELYLMGTAVISFGVGYALGIYGFSVGGHDCREDGCYALVGAEHDKCPNHRGAEA